MTLTVDSQVTASGQLAHRPLADEVVILDPRSRRYFGLDQVGARIWELVQQPCVVAEIRDTLLEEYDVSAEECERDVLLLLESLLQERLIEPR